MFQCVQARPALGSGLPLNSNMRGPYAGDIKLLLFPLLPCTSTELRTVGHIRCIWWQYIIILPVVVHYMNN